ncbi:MAG TPA: tetratricopeptide repeat protein, partial [Chthonomonadaceae bacterium]|nr:tetratricopeptide repeat protein [Chthonomonadaceae bacterium]
TTQPVSSLSKPELPHAARRRGVLLAILLVLALAWPISRRLLLRPAPAPLPANADDAARIRYDLAELQVHPADGAAYRDLGGAYERQGYYMAALKSFTLAQAMGVSEPRLAQDEGRCLLNLGRDEEARSLLAATARSQPDNADVVLDQAALEEDQNHEKEAARLLQEFVQRHPDLQYHPLQGQGSVLRALATALGNANRPDLALPLAQALIRLARQDPAGYTLAGKDLLALHRPQEALQPLQTAARLAPDVAEIHHLHALALTQAGGHADEALAEWQRTVALKADDGEAFYQIGLEYRRRHDWRRAGTGLMQALQLGSHGARAAALAADMWERAGGTTQTIFCRSQAEQLSGDSAAALQDYLKLAHDRDARWRDIGINGAADIYHATHRYREYLALIRQAADSGRADDMMRLADAYGYLTDWGNRVLWLRKVLAVDPKRAGHIHHELGTIDENQGSRDEAEREFEQAIALDPKNMQYCVQLSQLYLERASLGDRSSRALQMAQRAVQLDPQSADAFFQLGQACVATNQLRPAVTAYQHAIDLQPGYGPSYRELGQTYTRLGEIAEGKMMLALYRKYEAFDMEKQELTTRSKARPKDATAQMALGDFYVRARDFSHATELYERAVRLAPENGTAHAHLARLYRVQGREEDAREQERLAHSAAGPGSAL